MNPTCNKIKVVHVITRFDKGGSAENTFLTVRDLDKARYDVVFIKGTSPPGNSGDLETEAIEANIAAAREHHVRLICLRHLVRDLQPFSDLAAFFSLLRIIRREKPHIVHTHTSKAGILGRWAAYFCRVPIIVHTPHGHVFWGYFNSWQTRLFILLERWTARITNAIVTLTPRRRKIISVSTSLRKKNSPSSTAASIWGRSSPAFPSRRRPRHCWASRRR